LQRSFSIKYVAPTFSPTNDLLRCGSNRAPLVAANTPKHLFSLQYMHVWGCGCFSPPRPVCTMGY